MSQCNLLLDNNQEEAAMRVMTIALATAFALATSFALAQSPSTTAGGSSKAGGPAATKTTTGASMDGSTTMGVGKGSVKGSVRHKKPRKHKRM
jgi:hypothetical protein